MVAIITQKVFGLLLFIGGIWTIYAAHNYFKVLKQKGTGNIFSPFGVYYGYFIGFMFALGGIAIFFNLL